MINSHIQLLNPFLSTYIPTLLRIPQKEYDPPFPDTFTLQIQHTLNEFAVSVEWSSCGQKIMCLTSQGRVFIYEPVDEFDQGEWEITFDFNTYLIKSICWDQYIYFGDDKGILKIYSLDYVLLLEIRLECWISSISISDSLCICGLSNGSVVSLYIEDMKVQNRKTLVEKDNQPINCITTSPKYQYNLAIIVKSSRLLLVDLTTQNVVDRIKLPFCSISTLIWNKYKTSVRVYTVDSRLFLIPILKNEEYCFGIVADDTENYRKNLESGLEDETHDQEQEDENSEDYITFGVISSFHDLLDTVVIGKADFHFKNKFDSSLEIIKIQRDDRLDIFELFQNDLKFNRFLDSSVSCIVWDILYSEQQTNTRFEQLDSIILSLETTISMMEHDQKVFDTNKLEMKKLQIFNNLYICAQQWLYSLGIPLDFFIKEKWNNEIIKNSKRIREIVSELLFINLNDLKNWTEVDLEVLAYYLSLTKFYLVSDEIESTIIDSIPGHFGFDKISKRLHKCGFCNLMMGFDSHEEAICENGHGWQRCMVTFMPLDTLDVRNCLLCNKKRIEFESYEGPVMKIMAGFHDCIYCGSVMKKSEYC